MNPNAPTIATLLSQSTGNVGDSVNDSATLSGATADAGGTVEYAFYSSLSACNAGTFATPGGTSLGTKTVTAGVVPNSDPTGPINAAGTYYFRAFYSGDNNNKPALSACTAEKLVVAPLVDLAITKTGSAIARRLLVESAWHYAREPRIGATLANRQAGQPDHVLQIAWRAQHRLHRVGARLRERGKPGNVATVAVARELAGFLWAAATAP